MDLATLGGIALALLAILGGQVLEGGHVSSILQPTAALIVLGGTIGAAAVQFPAGWLARTLSSLRLLVYPEDPGLPALRERFLELAHKARRDGLVSIDREVAALDSPFLRRALELAVDGTDLRLLRSALDLEIERAEEEGEVPVKVLEAMGGYAPTIGILGAVLGLIHVMENLSDPAKLGSGIAVAFVATVYGVGSANLLFLPMAGKLKTRLRETILSMEMITEATCALAEGINPRFIERGMTTYLAARHAGESSDEALARSELAVKVR